MPFLEEEEGVRAAVEGGTDVDSMVASGYLDEDIAFLQHVAGHGTSSMVRLLVEGLGANVDVPNKGLSLQRISVGAAGSFNESAIVSVRSTW